MLTLILSISITPAGKRAHTNGKTVWKNKNCERRRAVLSLILISAAIAAVVGLYRVRIFGRWVARWNQRAGRVSMLSPELRRAALNPCRAAKVGWKPRKRTWRPQISQQRELTWPRALQTKRGHAKFWYQSEARSPIARVNAPARVIAQSRFPFIRKIMRIIAQHSGFGQQQRILTYTVQNKCGFAKFRSIIVSIASNIASNTRANALILIYHIISMQNYMNDRLRPDTFESTNNANWRMQVRNKRGFTKFRSIGDSIETDMQANVSIVYARRISLYSENYGNRGWMIHIAYCDSLTDYICSPQIQST